MDFSEIVTFILPTMIFFIFIVPITYQDGGRLSSFLRARLNNPHDVLIVKKWFLNSSFFLGAFVAGVSNNHILLMNFHEILIFYITTVILLWTCLASIVPERLGLGEYVTFHRLLAASILLGQCSYIVGGKIALVNFTALSFFIVVGIFFVYQKLKKKVEFATN